MSFVFAPQLLNMQSLQGMDAQGFVDLLQQVGEEMVRACVRVCVTKCPLFLV